MKPPEEVKSEFTREWIQKAESDYLTAKYLFESGEDYLYGVTFHAQQAAEKYIKAFLVWHQIEFKKTHDIEVLLKLATVAASDIYEILAEAIELTPYGVEYRYPGDYRCELRRCREVLSSGVTGSHGNPESLTRANF